MDSHAYDDNIIIPTLNAQMGLDLPEFDLNVQADQGIYFNAEVIDLEYDLYLIMMSAGKDSLACLLHLLEQGVPPERIELWHHLVDGAEGSTLMDWPCIHDYNQKIAEHFNIPIYYSWLKHGFEGEMLKNNSVSHPDMVETPDGLITLERDIKRAKPSTRLKFPQVSSDLKTRWCSGQLKIALARRARYNQFEPHACDRRNGKLKRHIDTWRPVLGWSEERVWDILKRHRIIAPVPYRLNWSRSSCLSCIFNGPRIWATIREHFPE
ncbi:MAG: phosphohydrolase, partial [Pseudomonadota bacterium]|nr:phosphohydrolase [Pseudomonadota bacterium]